MRDRNEKGQFGAADELNEYQDLFDSYSGWLTSSIEKQTTIKRRKEGAKFWLHYCESDGIDPVKATENNLNAWIFELVSENLAETTISNRFASVSKFYHYLTTHPKYPDDIENPAAEINLRNRHDVTNNAAYTRILHRDGREDIIAPDYEELEPLFDHVPGGTDFTRVRNELICRLFWQTALRSDELARVKTDNTDMEEREIKVRSSKLNPSDHPDLYNRLTFYEPNLDYLMHRYLNKRSEKADDNCEYLLIGDRGGGLDSGYLSRIVKRAAHNAGIQEPLVTDSEGGVKQWLYTAHRLRHSRITHLANKTNMDLNFIRMMAGHSSMDTTLSYVQPDWSEAREAFRNATQNKEE